MFETILVVSYIAIWFLSSMITWLLAPALILAYTYLYAYIASFFVVREGILDYSLTVYSFFSYALIALSLLLFVGTGKRTKSGKIDKRYSKQNKKDKEATGEIAGPCFVIGVGCLLLKYGLDQIIAYFS